MAATAKRAGGGVVSLAYTVKQHFPPEIESLLSAYQIEHAERVAPGMSGGTVFQCFSADDRTFALKRWPRETTPHRVAQVHRVQRAAAINGCHFVPRLYAVPNGSHTCLRADHGCWELSDWMPGTPLDRAAWPQPISRGAAAIAQFHRAVAALQQSTAPPPAIANRLTRLDQLDRLLPQTFASDHDSSDLLRETVAEVCCAVGGVLVNHPRSNQTFPGGSSQPAGAHAICASRRPSPASLIPSRRSVRCDRL